MLVAVLVALAGIVLAWLRYGRARAGERPRKSDNPLHQLVSEGYYFDAFYDRFVVRFWAGCPLRSSHVASKHRSAARACADQPHAGARVTRLFARLQTGDLQAYVIYALIGLAVVLGLGAVT